MAYSTKVSGVRPKIGVRFRVSGVRPSVSNAESLLLNSNNGRMFALARVLVLTSLTPEH